MPVHYGPQIGIPYCGDGVSSTPNNRNSRWKGAPIARTKKKVTAQKDTTQVTGDVDCASCITQMQADGIIP